MRPDDGRPKIPLPEEDRTAETRRDRGVRSVRHLSNWTLAALVVGVGATSAVIARSTQPTASTAATAPTAAGAATGAGASAGAGQASAPTVHSPVAITTPSGVVIQGATPGVPTAQGSTAQGSTVSGARRAIYAGDT